MHIKSNEPSKSFSLSSKVDNDASRTRDGGTEPLNKFFASSKVSIFARSPSSVGREPTNPLPVSFSLRNSLERPTSGGNVPAIRFALKSSTSKETDFPTLSLRVPLISFLDRSTSVRLGVNNPFEMVPVNLFSRAFNTCKLTRPSIGKDPVNEFLSTDKVSRLCILSHSVGIVPLILFDDTEKCRKFLSELTVFGSVPWN
mmetsp:Transcript_8783/g.26289  ORF Transcript_8783/g.26289 Transcript_8783/m.26289 type:complete len:200 (+) Transcript_8783:255-854(+)